MNLVQRALDATFGKALEWAGRHWFSGRSESDRLRTVYRDLTTAMRETVEAAAAIGQGYWTEENFIQAGGRAELQVGATSAEIVDEELLAAIRAFRESAAFFFAHRVKDDGRLASMRAAFDRTADRVRVLQSSL